jgi:hypothetical protein
MAKKIKLENIEVKKFSTRDQLDIIKELSVRNEYPVSKVRDIYIGFYYKTLYGLKNGKRGFRKYSPELEEKVFNLTERYLDIERIKELKKMMSLV